MAMSRMPTFQRPPRGRGLLRGRFGARRQQKIMQLKQSESQSERVAQRMNQEVDQEIRDENAVDKQEKQKFKLTVSEEKLVSIAIKELGTCKIALTKGAVNPALKSMNNAINAVNKLLGSEGVKIHLTQMEGQEIVRDESITQTEEAQTLLEERSTKGRQKLRRTR